MRYFIASLIVQFFYVVRGYTIDETNWQYETKFIDVPLDHFSFTTNQTFSLRYLINNTYWSEDSPIFFYTGNEGDINLFAQNTGFVFELAPKFNALIVFAEHRYYGTSLPFGNLSYSDPEHLGYLTGEQALEDFVFVIDYLQSQYGKDGNLPVIAFGGSYGGVLAAWIRFKYPDSVLGSIAASAPIWQFTNLTGCEVFNRIVTSVFASSSSDDCSVPIKESWNAIRNVTETDEGKLWLTQNWTLCTNLTSKNDVNAVVDWLSNIWTNLAMANYPYEANFLAPLPPNPVKEVCKHLEGHSKYDDDPKTLLYNIGLSLQVYTNYTGTTTCNDIGINITPDLGTLGWDFQACTEMIMPMCSIDSDMFENSAWDFGAYSESCFQQFKVKQSNPRLPVLKYGTKDISFASNIVFSNGLLDPWSGGGVLSNVSDSVSAILIPEGAHHIDLRESNKDDPESVKGAREYHAYEINRWLEGFKSKKWMVSDDVEIFNMV